MAKPRLLFLCTGNSARSQMAEGYLRHVAGDKYEALSAGVEPKGLNPLAVEAMREIGIDISQQRSKDVREYVGTEIFCLITVCDNAKERCPIFAAAYKMIHWSLPDPAAALGTRNEKLEAFRRTRDEIMQRVQKELLDKELLDKEVLNKELLDKEVLNKELLNKELGSEVVPADPAVRAR
jgi:arsenate reductase